MSASLAGGAGGLERADVVRMIVISLAGWALAVLAIRGANMAGLFHGAAEAVLFALCFPIAWGTAVALRRSGRLRANQIVPAMVIGVIPALFLDGLALTLAPWIYGASPDMLLPASAWLLFGVGAFLGAAYLEARRG